MIDKKLKKTLQLALNRLINSIIVAMPNTLDFRAKRFRIFSNFTKTLEALQIENSIWPRFLSGEEAILDVESRLLQANFNALFKFGFLDTLIIVAGQGNIDKEYESFYDRLEYARMLERTTNIDDVRLEIASIVFDELTINQVNGDQNSSGLVYKDQLEIWRNMIWAKAENQTIRFIDLEGHKYSTPENPEINRIIEAYLPRPIYLETINFYRYLPSIIYSLGIGGAVAEALPLYKNNPNRLLSKIFEFNYWMNRLKENVSPTKCLPENLSSSLFFLYKSDSNRKLFFHFMSIGFITLKRLEGGLAIDAVIRSITNPDEFIIFMEDKEEIVKNLALDHTLSHNHIEIMKKIYQIFRHDRQKAEIIFNKNLATFYYFYTLTPSKNSQNVFGFIDECYFYSKGIFNLFAKSFLSRTVTMHTRIDINFKEVMMIFIANPSRAELLLSRIFQPLYGLDSNLSSCDQRLIKSCNPQTLYRISENDPILFRFILNRIGNLIIALEKIKCILPQEPPLIEESFYHEISMGLSNNSRSRNSSQSLVGSQRQVIDFDMIISLKQEGMRIVIEKADKISLEMQKLFVKNSLNSCEHFEYALKTVCPEISRLIDNYIWGEGNLEEPAVGKNEIVLMKAEPHDQSLGSKESQV